MGTNNLETKNPGDVISSDDPNQFKTSETQNKVPRNSSGIPTDIAGGLGTTLFRWATSYISKIFFGTASEECSIENTGNNLTFQIGGVTKSFIDVDGFDGQYMKDGTIEESKFQNPRQFKWKAFTSSGDYDLPSDVDGQAAVFIGCGGGGGGGGAGSAGGGGGAGATPQSVIKSVTASDTITITIGFGGAGGPKTVAGSTGATTTLTGTGLDLAFPGANGGGGGGGNTSPGAGGSSYSSSYAGVTSVTPGGVGSNQGSIGRATSGGVNPYVNTAALGGSSAFSPINGGGGGGGGAGFGPGGAGGSGQNSGIGVIGENAAANTGAGGGGGGGEAASGNGNAGGSGGSGVIYIGLVTSESWS